MSAPDRVTGIIGILTQENGRYARFWLCLAGIQTPTGTKVITKLSLDVAEARNQIMDEAEKLEADWVWFLDDDHEFAPTLLRDLLAWNVDVVQPLVLTRYSPFQPVIMGPLTPDGKAHWRYALDPKDPPGLKRVVTCGAGGMLIRRRAWTRLTKPYFRVGQITPGGLGEDIDLCRRLGEAGCEIYADLTHSMSHLNVGSVRPHRKEDGTWCTILSFGHAEIEIEAARPQHTYDPITGAVTPL